MVIIWIEKFVGCHILSYFVEYVTKTISGFNNTVMNLMGEITWHFHEDDNDIGCILRLFIYKEECAYVSSKKTVLFKEWFFV